MTTALLLLLTALGVGALLTLRLQRRGRSR
jgi:hypothetical protein